LVEEREDDIAADVVLGLLSNIVIVVVVLTVQIVGTCNINIHDKIQRIIIYECL
jgi:hypothetical protein